MTTPPVARSMTKTDAAYQTLRTAIEDGRFPPGDRLTIGRLCEELAMSPTPIREAIRMLQVEGLLDHEPHRGVVVAAFSLDNVNEIYRLRAALEPMAAELAAERASDDQLAQMRRIHDELVRVVAGDAGRMGAASLNAEWHAAIYEASDSRYLQEFIARLWVPLPVRAVWLTSRGRESVLQHEEIMVALEARDAATAGALMREHIAFGARSTAEHLRAIGQQ